MWQSLDVLESLGAPMNAEDEDGLTPADEVLEFDEAAVDHDERPLITMCFRAASLLEVCEEDALPLVESVYLRPAAGWAASWPTIQMACREQGRECGFAGDARFSRGGR